jgi:hypothetical protein
MSAASQACTSCGADIRPEDAFCTACGHRVDPAPATPPPAGFGGPITRNRVVIGLAAAIAVALAAGVTFMLLGGDNDDAPAFGDPTPPGTPPAVATAPPRESTPATDPSPTPEPTDAPEPTPVTEPTETPPEGAFATAEEAVAFVLNTVASDPGAFTYSGACGPHSPFDTWCSSPVSVEAPVEIHAVGLVATSDFAGIVVIETEGSYLYPLGWDPAMSVGAGTREVSGLANCLNERDTPGTGEQPLRCHPPGTSITTTDRVAWADGYLWLETSSGTWMAARWLCLDIHCPYEDVPDTTWVISR